LAAAAGCAANGLAAAGALANGFAENAMATYAGARGYVATVLLVYAAAGSATGATHVWPPTAAPNRREGRHAQPCVTSNTNCARVDEWGVAF